MVTSCLKRKDVVNMDSNHRYAGRLRCFLGLIVLLSPTVVSADETAGEFFDQQVAPLLVRRCLECHNGFDLKGKLDLSNREGALRGGESGPAIHADRPTDSLVWERV
ncbi:MAG TPA: hypothetical protein EYN70_07280, partial [Planctomycetaceae bacterium]|nr:hypothetical protein [Planctomycetaceae bacterium]